MDTDGRFDVARLVEIMQTMLRQGRPSENGDSGADHSNQIIMNALKHVHIFRPQSLQSLVATVQTLPRYLLNPTKHPSSERSLDLLAIDSIGAFFWQEKMTEEALKFDSEEFSTHNNQRHTAANQYSHLVTHLRALQQRFGCAIIATNWGISPAPPQRGALYTSYRSFLPPVWQAFITTRIVVERDAVTKFPVGMLPKQAKRDAPVRQAAVDEGRFSAWVEQRQDAMNRERADAVGVRKVAFLITQEGVSFEKSEM